MAVNITIVILVIIAVIFIIIIAIMIIYGINHNGKTIPAAKKPCSNNVDLEKLLNISELPPCYQGGVSTNLFYIQEQDMVVASFGTSPLDVCVNFCDTYLNSICKGPNYGGLTAQQNFDKCILSQSSNYCIPPKPVARRQNIIYYSNSPTKNSCEAAPL